MLRIGIIGTGNMALEYLKVLKSYNDICHVIGIVGRNAEKAQRLKNKFRLSYAGQNIAELHKKCHLDAVIICVSIDSILKVTTEACNFDWQILLEKPFGLNFKEAKVLSSEIKRNNSKVFLALNRRSYSVTQQVLNKIDALKGNRFLSITDQQNLNDVKKEGFSETICKNWMFANSIHLIDYMNIFCRGKIIKIEKFGCYSEKSPAILEALVFFESGDIAKYTALWNQPARWEVTLSLKDYFWRFKPLEECTEINSFSRNPVIIKQSKSDLEFKTGIHHQVGVFLNYLITNEPLPSWFATSKDAFETMQLVDKIYSNYKIN